MRRADTQYASHVEAWAYEVANLGLEQIVPWGAGVFCPACVEWHEWISPGKYHCPWVAGLLSRIGERIREIRKQ